MVGLSGSIIFCQKQQVHCADVKMAKGVPFGRESKNSTHECSVRPKPLFWFRSDTETETKILSADAVTDTETTFQRENLVRFGFSMG